MVTVDALLASCHNLCTGTPRICNCYCVGAFC